MDLPLINTGTKEKPTYVIAEWIEILPGQPLKAKLSPAEQDAMIQFACREAPANALSVTTSAREVLALDNNKLLSDFGISVSKSLVTVKGRQLPPPSIVYRDKTTGPKSNNLKVVNAEGGGWLMKNARFLKSCPLLDRWTYLYQGNAGSLPDTMGRFAKFLR